MDRRRKEGLARLSGAFALNVALSFIVIQLALWSGVDREFRLSLVGSFLAALALVLVVPVFWKGAPWHAPLAFLLVVLPGFIIFSVCQFFTTHW
jgi:hypothetical protein